MVFKQLASLSKQNDEFVFLGAPEAEAEALPTSKMPLVRVYRDYNNLIQALSNEKFILLGRKGSGKSAFAEHVCSLAADNANIFAKFIRHGDANLEHVVQIGRDQGHKIERENLFKWLILTNILKLFTENLSAQNNKEYKQLEKFLKKNSGYIDIKESEVKELVEKQGFEVHTEYLKRFFSGKFGRNSEIKRGKAPFFRLIPHLKEVLLLILKSPEEKENKNNYVLFFDDLDIPFSANNQNSIDSILSLTRVCKEINNDFFGKNNLDSKVIILLRDDICKRLSTESTDAAKIFASYSVNISWYQDGINSHSDERDLNIRKFINDRILVAFEAASLQVSKEDPWKSLVEDPFKNSQNPQKTSFKYILDHTLFRPRDLLLFFRPLATHPFSFPLSKFEINHLIKRYCEELIGELKNELFSFYTKEQIQSIFSAFGEISQKCTDSESKSISYDFAFSILEITCKDIQPKPLLEDMYSRSLVGNIASNGFVFFKHREPKTDTYELKKEHNIIIHPALRIYCENKGYA